MFFLGLLRLPRGFLAQDLVLLLLVKGFLGFSGFPSSEFGYTSDMWGLVKALLRFSRYFLRVSYCFQ